MIFIVLLFVSSCRTALANGGAPTLVFLPDEDIAAQNPLLSSLIDLLGLQYLMLNQSEYNHSLSYWTIRPEYIGKIRFVWTELDYIHVNQYFILSKTTFIQLNRIPGFDILTNDDKFTQHLKRMQQRYGRALFQYVPHYFLLPRDYKQYTVTHTQIKKLVQYEEKRTSDPLAYQRFIARTLSSSTSEATRYKSVQILTNQKEVKQFLAQHDKQLVEIRQYIEPFLLEGHKFNFGVYVAVPSINPLRIYSHRIHLIKIASKEYPNMMQPNTTPSAYTFDNYTAPWDFPPLMRYFVEFPSPNSEGSDAWEILKRYMRSYGIDVNHMEEEITDAIVKSVLSVKTRWEKEIRNVAGEAIHSNQFIQLFQFDFEIDDIGRPWLIQVHSNPTLKPVESILSTDEALRKNVLLDFLKLANVAVHPDRVYETVKRIDERYCSVLCGEKRLWDRNCWFCPDVHNQSHTLYEFSQEYTRRGRFDLIFPSLKKEYDWIEGAISNDLTRQDLLSLFNTSMDFTTRFEGSLSSTFCTYRAHCSDHGDCVNGVCVCDEEYEGRTCYILRDIGLERMRKPEKSF
ncbi:hypothetical protein ABG067_000571 [Albugo candida]